MKKTYSIRGKVELFPQENGWHYVRVPKKHTEKLKGKTHWGLIPIEATVGETSWKTSLLPMGDGTHFIALNAKVRKKEKVEFGKTVNVTFTLR